MLYIVGTPIGNLEDLSVRQAQTIASAEILLTEDTRSTGFLLQKISELFGLTVNANQRLISYYKEKEFEKLPEILELLKEGKEIALISQAGMPLYSDPGLLLVKHTIKNKIPLTVIPGPTAAATALALSGMDSQFSMFVGFLPKKEKDLRKLLQKLQEVKKVIPETTFVAYESPERITSTLSTLAELFPTAEVSVSRELTKKFEETVRGSASKIKLSTLKGEITIVFS